MRRRANRDRERLAELHRKAWHPEHQIRCPACEAEPGELCRWWPTASSTQRKQYHLARKHAALLEKTGRGR